MIFELETAIKTALESLEDTPWSSLFRKVEDFHTLKGDGFPFATFELSSFNGEEIDSCSNIRSFVFNIAVIQNIDKLQTGKITRDIAKEIIYAACEKIILKFDGDMDLWISSIIKGDVSKWELATIIEWQGSILALDIELTLYVETEARQ